MRKIFFYSIELLFLGIGIVSGNLIGYLLIAGAVTAIVVTALLGGDLNGFKFIDGKISLSKASAMMFDKANERTKDFVDGNSTIEEYRQPQNFFKQILKIDAGQSKIKVYGRRGENLSEELIPYKVFREGGVIRGDVLEGTVWIDLRVSRSDALRSLSDYEANRVETLNVV